jgi:ABC-type bacteriocin/lantibiotic exporter with double-glycine peptidase domain/CRP-like cAMP-binding protein
MSASKRKPAPRKKPAAKRRPAKARRKPPARKPSSTSGVHPILRDLPMLEFMPAELRKLVAESFVPLSFPFGAEIVREGDDARALYILASGRARAVQQGDDGEEVPLHVLEPGDAFGERGLLAEAPRTATVRASSEVTALRLDRSIFQALVRSYPGIRESFELHVRRMDLENFLRHYSAFASLPSEALALMLRELRTIEVRKGEAVVREGQPPGSMYIVEDGKLRAYKKIGRRNTDVAYLRKGDFFGEVSTLKHAPREATVEAVTDVQLLALDAKTYTKLLKTVPAFREQIRQRVAQYDYRTTANVPLDFAEEILPAAASARESVSAKRVPDEAPPTDALPEEVDEGPFARPKRRIRRFPLVYQLDEMDCGAACLAMVTRHFGRAVSIGHIRDTVGVSADGTSLLGITEGAKSLGLAASSIKASKSRLDDLPLPAVAHFDGNHWVVVHDVDRRRVRVADPAIGLRRMKREEFEQKWSGYATLLAATPDLENAPVQRSRSRWIWEFVRPHRGTLIRATILALVSAGLSMLIPVFSQLIVDHVLAQRDIAFLNTVVLGMVGVLVLLTVATIGQRYLLSRTAVTIDGNTLDFIMGKLLGLPMSYFYSRRTGDISRRLTGFRQAREFFVGQGVEALTAATQLVVAIVLMFVYSRLLAVVFVAVVPAYVGLMQVSNRRLRPMYDSLEEAWGKYHGRQIDAIKGIETVKSIGAEELLRGRLLDQFRGLSRRLFRTDFTVMVFEGAVSLVTFVSLALFLWVGAHQVIDGHLTVGGLVSFNALVLLASGPLQLLVSMWDEFQLASVLLNRLNDVFEQEPEQGADRSGLKAVRTLGGAIRFKDVWFWYPSPQPTPILEGISLDVAPGTTVAIVGRSGSGKTTLVKCLAGLIEPTRGSITYDRVDLLKLDHRELRQRIGFVLQDPYLFDDTIARNIAFGIEEPDMEAVERAARIANAHDFIDRLPLGYDTWIGETGLLLSGGQRQRIAIARAVYVEPPVLIFDEATSSLDTESERAVQANVDRLLEGRTCFVIAHRLSTIRSADLIVVLEKGKLVEQGTHDELMGRQGLYYYLVSQQLSV